MPLYEYECETCHHRFEVRQTFADPPIETCIRCGKSVRKLISAPGLMFKGTGWYVTDYSNKLKEPASSQHGEGGGKSDTAQGDQAKDAPAKSGAGSTADSASSPSPSAPSGSTSPGAAAKPGTSAPKTS